jgi:hypothetical protein
VGEEFKFWIGLVIVAFWVISGIREAKQRERVKRQREERLRNAPPVLPVPTTQAPTSAKPIEAVSEEGLTAKELIEQILNQRIEEEDFEETIPESTAAEHTMTEAYQAAPASTAEQMAAVRARELAKLAEEGRRRVGQSSSPAALPKLLFPQGAAQVIIAAEILQPPKALRSRHAPGRF